jgi:hypothetical protein
MDTNVVLTQLRNPQEAVFLRGPEAYLEICALQPDMKAIFTTGYVPKARDLVSMVEKGASIIRKPYSLISLREIIRGTLEQVTTAAREVLAMLDPLVLTATLAVGQL